jgi:hypothetical protein
MMNAPCIDLVGMLGAASAGERDNRAAVPAAASSSRRVQALFMIPPVDPLFQPTP